MPIDVYSLGIFLLGKKFNDCSYRIDKRFVELDRNIRKK